MSHYPPSLLRLIKYLSRLPGIGEKTAARLAMHILRAPKREAEALAESILEARERVRFCSSCFALADMDPCLICQDPKRDADIVCVVEQPADMIAIERSDAFCGRYHVLHGVLSPINGIGPDNIRIRELFQRIQLKGITELIIATSTSVEGEATAAYIGGCLQGHGVRITRIASGVPIGGDLKYIDGVTLKRALERRHALE